MLSWQWPFLFYLLPVPLLVRWLLPAKEQAPQAIRVPFYDELTALDADRQKKSAPVWFQAFIASLIWVCLVTAVARPTWVGDPVPLPQEGRDLMLAVDLSRSMIDNVDMPTKEGYVTRLVAVKTVVSNFVEKRLGDRIGLILFGNQAYLQTPLTFDTTTVNQQLQEAQQGFAGDYTAIGDAIGLAIKHLRNRPAESRILILLTDGVHTPGTASPKEAADIAAEANIRIHTIGVGNEFRLVRDPFGRIRKVDAPPDLDEETLTYIAEATGGEYFRARDPAELLSIYNYLDALEPMPEEQTFRPTMSLFHWPAALALILSGLMVAVRIWSDWRASL